MSTASSSPYQVGGSGAIGEYAFDDARLPDIASQDVLDDLDLHLYDEQGNHVGRNYESGEFENEIPGAVPSGPDEAGRSYEQIRVNSPDQGAQFELEVVGLETSGPGSSFSTRVSELSGVDAILTVSPGSIQADPNADTVERRVTVEEAADAGSLSDVTFSPEALTSPDSDDEVPAGNVSVSDNNIDLGAGETASVTLTLDVPDELEPGTYTGDVEVATANQSTAIALAAEVRAGPPPVVGDRQPRDLDGDGLFEDINGDGNFGIGDVQLFFQNRDSEVVQNNAEFFNFDGRQPADVTIADVQAMFQLFVERDD